MATEENKKEEEEVKSSAVKNIVHILEDQNSYINSAKERMNDVIDTFLNNAENSVALNDFSSIVSKPNFVVFRSLKPSHVVISHPGRCDEKVVAGRPACVAFCIGV